MDKFLWLIPAFPFAGALILILGAGKISRSLSAIIGCGSVASSAIIVMIFASRFMADSTVVVSQTLWVWFNVDGLAPSITFHLDALSMIFIFVITFVGFLIHMYSVEYMTHDEGFSRFFAYLNLFVCSMLILVLADNLVLMYLGWEGVGVCSYLLIGFWYTEEKNGYAARKAFIITRVGDTAMAVGLFMLFRAFGTLTIQEILTQAPTVLTPGSDVATAIALLLLGGAVGKSAQLPLQTWLPDAMAGPSPVSALIHAATMVTAGVYLIARTNVLFTLAPTAQLCVAIVGAVTLLIAGFSALTQNDLKRVLAYSTISQIGYMFLALGIGAWSAAVFHFMIHAFFKALLFLAAGAVITVLHHEQDMFKMGGLRRKVPLIFWTFVIGSASLAAVPLITAGFYSKDQIVWLSLAGVKGNAWLFFAAIIGAFVTALYTFRMVFLTFFGEAKTKVGNPTGVLINIPLVVLAVLSIIAGFIELPHTLGHISLFSDVLLPVLPDSEIRDGIQSSEWIVQLVTATLCFTGIYLAYFFYMKRADLRAELKSSMIVTNRFWYSGWGFDYLYDLLFVKPFVWMSNINKSDVVDRAYDGIVNITTFFHDTFARTQNGTMRWYIMGIVIGAIFILSIGLIL